MRFRGLEPPVFSSRLAPCVGNASNRSSRRPVCDFLHFGSTLGTFLPQFLISLWLGQFVGGERVLKVFLFAGSFSKRKLYSLHSLLRTKIIKKDEKQSSERSSVLMSGLKARFMSQLVRKNGWDSNLHYAFYFSFLMKMSV